MGWYSCYTALKLNGCVHNVQLKRRNPKAWENANKTNVQNDRKRAWTIAEQKIKEDHNLEKEANI